jgi:hypothetical protein
MILSACWFGDKEALQRQREAYARKSDARKIVRIKAAVEPGLQAALHVNKQAISLRKGVAAPITLTIKNLSKSTETVRVIAGAQEIILVDCHICSQGQKLAAGAKMRFNAKIDLHWSELNAQQDYVYLPIRLVPHVSEVAE